MQITSFIVSGMLMVGAGLSVLTEVEQSSPSLSIHEDHLDGIHLQSEKIAYGVRQHHYDTIEILALHQIEDGYAIQDRTLLNDGGRPLGNFNPKDILVDEEGALWILTQGNPRKDRKTLLIKADQNGNMIHSAEVPQGFDKVRSLTNENGLIIISDQKPGNKNAIRFDPISKSFI